MDWEFHMDWEFQKKQRAACEFATLAANSKFSLRFAISIFGRGSIGVQPVTGQSARMNACDPAQASL
jgi:hypothetical protein